MATHYDPARQLPLGHTPAQSRFLHELFRLTPLAHHPTCPCFDNHLLRLFSRPLCLGCTCLFGGLATCLAVLVGISVYDFDLWLPDGAWALVAVGVGLFSPTLVQPFVQVRLFKIASRTSLGVAIGCLWFGSLVLLPLTPWGMLLRAIFVGVFWGVFRLALLWRARMTPDPCRTCPHGVYPFCTGNRSRLIRLVEEFGAGSADPADVEFLAVIRSLAGLDSTGPSVEVVSLEQLLGETPSKP